MCGVVQAEEEALGWQPSWLQMLAAKMVCRMFCCCMKVVDYLALNSSIEVAELLHRGFAVQRWNLQ